MPRKPKPTTYPQRRLVRLHLEGETGSIEGILTGSFDDRYMLEAAKYLEREDATHSVGTIEVERSRVVFLQIVSVEGRP